VNDPTLYDLTLNVARVSADRAAELIAHAVMNISG
jgi:cytidylate kinase